MNCKLLHRVVLLASLCALACAPEPPSLPVEQSGEELLSSAATSEGDRAPTPVPSGCSAERSCGKPTIVCKSPDEPRPCGAAGCVDMQFACSVDADCLEGYACQACAPADPWPCGAIAGKCRPRACAKDRDCGSPNLICSAGACTHKACRRSARCAGYCVSGACWNQPGWCHDTTLPPPP